MAIQGLQQINIGLPNESTGSDSLYAAFNKTKDNFTNLFANASPTPLAGNGIAISNVANAITVSANLVAGNNVVLTNSAGAIVINSLGGNSLSTITGVVAGTGLTGGGLVGNVTLSLASTGVAAASYTNPTITIDAQGRITSASTNVIAGTVTSVGLVPGSGIQINGGPITSNGNITVTNTGVTRLSAGTGITLSGSNGNVTVSAASSGAVTSVGISSTTLTATGTVVNSGNITVNIPTNTTVTLGNVVTNSVSITRTASAVGAGATVGGSSILTVSSAFGSSDPNSPASAQALRGRITGANLTGNSNYLTGVTGQYLITGTNASDFIKAGVLGVVGDQTTTADAAVVAYLDGDGGLTTAAAAYGVSMKNSTGGSGFDYGLDLQWIDLGLVGLDVPFKQADIRFNNGVELVANTANAVSINANVTVGIVVKSTAALYSALPSATTTGAGSRAFITDGNLVAAGNFGALVTGSGANNVPVYSDGTDWRIG
jgi:fibronectin-binding autotransporter adhesin